ncbi:MAG: RES domain-containing protein, partial [Agrococcus casei]
LYLSSSRDGVAAAMIKHTSANDPARTVIAVRVENARVFDLRDADSPDHAGISLDDATCDWQQQLREGVRPQSWSVRNTIEESGAHGLIDPSRKSPGLWHLVLFTWNTPSAPAVTVEER